MKLSALQQGRRSSSFRGASTLDSSVDGAIKSPAAVFWLVLHGLCCLISLVLGFRFSRLVFFLLFSASTTTNSSFYVSTPFMAATNVDGSMRVGSTVAKLANVESPANSTGGVIGSRVVVGRHGILIRPWPHPNPVEVMKAHRIIERVQMEQRIQFGVKKPRTVIAVTPTYVRTFQALHLTGVMHSLMNVPYDLIWIVVEAGGTTNETATLLAKSGLRTVHIGFAQKMPIYWEDRHRLESKMRIVALRHVREQKLDGVVLFADDSNMHSMELFDEIQKVNWMGAVSVGILAHSGGADVEEFTMGEKDKSSLLPVQGPACNSSNKLVGWHTFNSLPFAHKSARYIGDMAVVLPRKLEWASFVLNSRLVWKEAEDLPEWVRDFETIAGNGEQFDSPLSLLNDPSVVEPLGSCGRKVLLWWLRVEARADSKFPARWIIDPPLEVTVPAKRTPWPDAPPELPQQEKATVAENIEILEKRTAKARSSRSKRGSKRKHDARSSGVVNTRLTMRHSGEANLQQK